MKTVITLDPEYIPWEPGAPVVRLRRKRNKALAAVLSIGFMFVIVGALVIVNSQRHTPGEPVEALVAATQPAEQATPVAVPTPALVTRGQPGRLAVVRHNVVSFFVCDTFAVRSGEALLEAGDTANGPIVDVSGKGEVSIECADEIYKLD